ncbi:LemA family protein [Amygdalobacter indicium]|uniref:LemA family protein n=1 Tax=Amygdalobacter indicium TaxID=3029272 RepID=A0ABY8C442_9FIRM|nr:LemA family protein [Amygdalobacter indicium]WEG35461.1 LemA family protein [Amygdalobacter indicium]
MNKKLKTTIAAVVVVLLLAGVFSYNSLVGKSQIVTEKAASIDTQLQRRSDLIPNLVKSVKGYTKHEEAVFARVDEAREKLLQAKSMPEKAQADGEIKQALGSLLAVVENYPQLKSDKLFTQLMDELAGTENRLAYARDEYNKAARSNNMSVQTFPNMIFAKIFGFKTVQYYQADKQAAQTPQVDFSK